MMTPSNFIKRILGLTVILGLFFLPFNSLYAIKYQVEVNDNLKTLNIQGKVVDKSTGEIIPYCSISISNSYIGTASNELGGFEFEIDSLPIKITFSHINYQKQEYIVENTTNSLRIELVPLVNFLDEVVIENAEIKNDKIAMRLAKKVYREISSSSNNKAKYGRAFYRQKTQSNNEYSEFSEIIFDIRYDNGGIFNWDILEGRYALNEEGVNNKNYTKLSQILKSFQPETEDLIFPLHPELEEFYNVNIKESFVINNDEIAILKFSPKKDISIPIFKGEAYVNTVTSELLKIKGVILNDELNLVKLGEKNSSKKNYKLTYDIVFKKDSLQNLLLDYVKVDQEFDYYKGDELYSQVASTSNLTFFEYYTPNARKKLGRQFKSGSSDWQNLNEIGYNKEFWENNQIVKRTPVEKEVIDAFEKENAFESIYLNSKQEIALIQSKISQDDFIKKLDTAIKVSNIYSPIEKVYLHTDKNIINVKEDLWYSAYTVIGPSHNYSAASKVLYVDIVDKDNSVLFSQKQKLYDGTSKGNIKIPSNIPSGHYQLRAYTEWMHNLSPNYIFNKTITIINDRHNEEQLDQISNTLDIQFLPEGGDAVVGLTNRIAFIVIDSDGLGRSVQGKILDTKENIITQFKSNEEGMGTFNLKPILDEKYTAVLEDNSTHHLPISLDEGYNLFVNNATPNVTQLRVQASDNLRDDYFYVIGTIRNQKVFQGKYNFRTKPFVDIEVPKNRFPSGILTLTLFDKNMQPRCERVVFVNTQNELEIDATYDTAQLSNNMEGEVKIQIKDSDGRPVSANFSIAITDFSKEQKESTDSNILSYLLMESDVNGRINYPAKYFKDQSRLTKYNLDLVMLTNGWRRFKWETVNNNSFDTINKPVFTEGFTISGIAKNKNQKILPLTSLDVIIKSEEKIRMYSTATRDDGTFSFENIDHTGTSDITFNAYNENRKPIDVEITLETKGPINFRSNIIGHSIQSKNGMVDSYNEISETKSKIERDTSALNLKEATQLNEVVLEGKLERQKMSPSTYNIEPDQVIFVEDNDQDLMQALDRGVGVFITGNVNQPKVRLRGVGNVLWVIDGVVIPEDNPGESRTEGIVSPTLNAMINPNPAPIAIAALSVNDIERIEILKGSKASVFGARGDSGVILIYSKRGASQRSKIVDSPSFTIEGLSKEKEFYTPKYNVDTSQNPLTSLYWNASIITDKNGNASVRFPVSKTEGKIQIAIEALSFYGNPGAYLQTFQQ